MADYTITSPNTCALSVGPDNSIAYAQGEGVIVGTPDGRVFTEYLTPDDAAAAALAINPSYDVNNIYGPLALIPVTISDPSQSVTYGASVTLDCEYECTDPAATVTYEWLNSSGATVGTSSSLTISGVTQLTEGTYTCNVSASKANGQTGSATGTFSVTTAIPTGQFYLTRNANNISTGNYNVANNLDPATTELYFPADDLTVPYLVDIETGVGEFKTVGNPLSSGAQEFDLRINGEYFASFTLGASNGTHTHNF
jgi:hypothetical protein